MSGYIASARIVRAAPRLARGSWTHGGWTRDRLDDRDALDWEAATLVDTGGAETGRRGLLAERRAALAERWAAVRERWSQLKFYLLDAESWR